jgi:hypothetical protein
MALRGAMMTRDSIDRQWDDPARFLGDFLRQKSPARLL